MTKIFKPYPLPWDFNPDDLIYGCHAPFVGCGAYTVDRQFSWPDYQCTTRREYESWLKHITSHGYSPTKGYENAFVENKNK